MRLIKQLAKVLIFISLTGISYGSNESSSSQLLVNVQSEASLRQEGNDAVYVKIRLSPQSRATVWAQDRCESPQPNSYAIPRSGSYLIPLSAVGSQGDVNVCLSSNDGTLNASIRIVSKPISH
jgi:hypothetical protein